MCFSEQASIVSFTVGILGSALCFSLGTIPDKVVGLFLGYVSFMQGIEFLLWRHQVCDDYNRMLSIAGMLLNHLQPIMLGLIILYIARPKTSVSIIVLICIYTVVITIYSIPFFANTPNQCTLKNETNHLHWKWNSMKGSLLVYIYFAFTMCSIFILGVKYGVKFAFITLFTYASSLFLYHRAVAGALWCYYVAFLPLIYFIIRLLL